MSSSASMAVYISMLRGVNLVSHNRVKMDVLRSVYQSIKLQDAQTFIQSGNVIFSSDEKDSAKLAGKIRKALVDKCDIDCEVVLRTIAEMKQTIANNPFAGRKGIEPGKLLVTFFADAPSAAAADHFAALTLDPEEMHLLGREIYMYFPTGVGQSKLRWSSMEKKMKFPPGTARNWNSVRKMLEIAEKMEGANPKSDSRTRFPFISMVRKAR